MMLPTLVIFFRPQAPLDLLAQLEQIQRFLPALQRYSHQLSDWYIQGNTVAEALQHKVFDQGINPQALAKLQAQKNLSDTHRVFGLWNGRDQDAEATLSYLYREDMGCVIQFQLPPTSTLQNPAETIALIEAAVAIWQPTAVSLSTFDYSDQQVFSDRLAAGWMLYLDKAIEAERVPEAAQVKSLVNSDGTPGTLLISTGDTFDDTDPAHQAVANALEVRLVDQDLLPRYAEL